MNFKQIISKEISRGSLAFKGVNEILATFDKKCGKAVRTALKELENEGKILRDRRGGYCTPEQIGAFTGTVQGNARGFAFVAPENSDDGDYFVPPRSVNGAMDGDRVLAAPVKGTKDEAYILKVLSRGRKVVVGVFEAEGKLGRVYPDDDRLPEVIIPYSLTSGAKSGCKVVCEITCYPKDGTARGKITEILGEAGDFLTEEISVIRSYGLTETFSDYVLEEAEEVAQNKILPDGRRDLRDKLIFTVDGADTRDIDDAVSLEYADGEFRLGVHIADVSRYVAFRSGLDKEAYERGTSVYFPDRVLPMLPKALSNGACSLNEGEDRYALSCLMTFDEDGKRKDFEICESVIRSRHKMTYPDVTAICAGEKRICDKYSDVAPTVALMEKLCLIMERNRDESGAVNLDVKEAKIYVDDNGDIVIPDYKRTISERIIEQFMIAANECVAEFLHKNKAPCLYRIHESPSPEKAEMLFSFLKSIGINRSGTSGNVSPKDYQKIVKSVEGKSVSAVVNKVMLRSMQKARYCESNEGHFGLASECYCHFTSPIRRYPDLFVHRAVKAVLRADEKALKMYADVAHGAADNCSERERIADLAERDVDDLYKLAFMSERIGECYDAVISGVTAFGVFCELKNTVEGLIPLEYLPDDSYEYVEEKFALKGKKHAFRLGDGIKIRVDGCDYGKMRVLFSVCD